MCGYTVKRDQRPTLSANVDLDRSAAAVGAHTAGLMLTNPSTLGVFEENTRGIQRIVHEAGGLLYYDGANLNAILGNVKPGDMGFDRFISTFTRLFRRRTAAAGPGAGPVGVSAGSRRFYRYRWSIENAVHYGC